jgi:hypothetical protein
MGTQIVGRRAADGGLLPSGLTCCGGVTYAYIDMGECAEAARWIVVEQHELWCCSVR